MGHLNSRYKKRYPWSIGKGRDLPNAYVLPTWKKLFASGRPIVSFVVAPFRPMLNRVAKFLFRLIPQACPHNLAKGDVFDFIKLLQDTDFTTAPTPHIYNQDLAGFFTSIDTDRFIASWHLLLQVLNTTMSTHPGEILLVNPKKGNSTGNIVKGPNLPHPDRHSEDRHRRH